MTGGVVRSNSFEVVGVLAENTFNAINVGTAILGTDGISAAGGATTHDETEARTNNAMVSHAQRVVVVADGSKIGRLDARQDGRPLARWTSSSPTRRPTRTSWSGSSPGASRC